MARPKKDPAQRKNYHLRVPITDAQHELIEEAAKLGGQDKAAWARSVLLEAAKRKIARNRSPVPGI